MARYIDADKLSIYFNALAEHAEMEGLQNMAHVHRRCLQIIKEEPTADVVPKSEVDKIFAEIEKIIDEKYNRFIFKDQPYDSDEEIDAIINYSDSVSDAIAELKKKYTEGNDG